MNAKPPHIVDVTMFWGTEPAGGVRTTLLAKRRHLLALGWRHTLLVPGSDAPGMAGCGGIPIPRSGGYHFVANVGAASRRIDALAPDLIEASDPYTLAWAALASARRLNVPAVAFCHSDLIAMLCQLLGLPARGLINRSVEAALRRYLVELYERFDLVLAPSMFLTERLRSWGLSNVEWQPLGVDCRVFSPQWRQVPRQQALRRRLGLQPSTRILVYFGRFAPEKRLQLLADAVELLGPNHALLLIGAGPCAPKGRQIRLLPATSHPMQLAKVVACCDAFVHAGAQETFGLAALEAMACGIPTVLSAHAGLGELGADVALTLASDDPFQWAEAMSDTLRSPSQHRTVSALQKARTHDWRYISVAMRRRYERLLLRPQQECFRFDAPAGLELPQKLPQC